MSTMDGVKVSSLPGNVYKITLAGNGDHRFNPSSVAAINAALDEGRKTVGKVKVVRPSGIERGGSLYLTNYYVEKDPDAAAVVMTNEGRFFSNGLDLAPLTEDPSLFAATADCFQDLLKRMLLFPMPSIAAICGHAAAGGCMLALVHDYRFMSADRGYIFLSEVDVKLPVTPGMNAVIQSKIPGNAYYKAVLSGNRFTAKAAVEHGFMDAALPDSASTLEESLRQARALAERRFDRVTYRALKAEMFKKQIFELTEGGRGRVQEFLARL